jgi:hypothetical protein
LYALANAAVRAGSEAAMEMLIALPDMNSSMNGGWLFDYQYEEALSSNPVIGKHGDSGVSIRSMNLAQWRRRGRGSISC